MREWVLGGGMIVSSVDWRNERFGRVGLWYACMNWLCELVRYIGCG